MVILRDLEKFTIYVDVDDTLIRSSGTKRIPMPAMVDQVRSLYQRGASLICWSAGGGEYARRSAMETGLDHCFSHFLSKPNLMIDDQIPARWPMCEVIHPASCTDDAVTDALIGYTHQ